MAFLIRIIVVAGVFAVGAPLTAEADKGQKDSTHSKAAEHYKSGKRAYSLGNYEDALAAFTEAYNLSEKPDLLYNLAVCHEKLGQTDKAIAYYELYLEEKPDASDKDKVNEKIRTLTDPSAPTDDVPLEGAPTEDTQPDSPATPTSTENTASSNTTTAQTEFDIEQALAPEEKEPINKHKLAQGLLIGVGSLVIASGTLTAIGAYKKYSSYENICAPNCSDSQVSKTKALAIAADVQIVVGVAAVGAGLAWYFIDKKKNRMESASLRLSPSASAQGAGLLLQGQF